LAVYEYSLTGSFSGEQKTMTGVTGSPQHDGSATLSSSPTGITHTFVWDVAMDLPDLVNRTVYVRMQPTDGIAIGDAIEGNALVVDTKKPVISNVSAEQVIGSDRVKIVYGLADSDNALTVELDISDDGGATWTVTDTSVTGDIGLAITPGSSRSIIWDAGTDFSDRDEKDMRVRVRTVDTYQNASGDVESADFAVDVRAPQGLGSLKSIEADTSSIVWSWTPVNVESNFDHYEIWYGQNLRDVQTASETAIKWDSSDDRGLTNMGASSTTITGLNQAALYYAKILAIDSFGHQSTTDGAQMTTKSKPITSGGSSSGKTGGGVEADTVPPFKPILDQPQTPSNKTEVQFSGTAEPGSSIELYVGGKTVGLRVRSAQGNGAFTGSVVLGEGEYELAVTATDNSGNISERSDPRTVKIDLTVKLIEPGQSVVPETPAVPQEQVPPTATSVALEIPISPEEGATAGGGIFESVAGAKESPVLQAPQIVQVTGISLGNDITIVGKGIPNSEVIVFLRSDRAVVYRALVGTEGDWNVTHSQNDIELADGEHEVYALTLDPESQIKSQSSTIKKFSVKKNQLAAVLSYFDLTTTLLTVLLALLGVVVLLIGRGKNKIAGKKTKTNSRESNVSVNSRRKLNEKK